MQTELPLPFLVSVAVPPGLANLDGLTREEVSLLGNPFLQATPKIQDKLLRFFNRHSYEFHAHLDATSLESQDDVIALLDRGARKVFVAPDALSRYTDFGDRVLPVVSKPDISSASEHGLLVKNFDLSTPESGKFIAAAQSAKIKNLYLLPTVGTPLDKFIEAAQKANAIPILPSTGMTTDKSAGRKLLVSKVIAKYWKSDRQDGLIPTVVTDEAWL
ncbi:trifunctional histidinol dehydrogenase [Metarhizium acridum]|nr:trifunctional histidinol dehydrogenase [Metarhizium acridum]